MRPDQREGSQVRVGQTRSGTGAALERMPSPTGLEEAPQEGIIDETHSAATQVRNLLAETVHNSGQKTSECESAVAFFRSRRLRERTWRRRLTICWYRYRMLTMWSVLDPVEICITQVTLWSTLLVVIYRILVRLWRFFR
jgi:hypothetical protein